MASTWSHDLTFTLNQLEKANADARSPLKGRLDIGRVGAIEHSPRGTAVLQFTHDDSRCEQYSTSVARDLECGQWGASGGAILSESRPGTSPTRRLLADVISVTRFTDGLIQRPARIGAVSEVAGHSSRTYRGRGERHPSGSAVLHSLP